MTEREKEMIRKAGLKEDDFVPNPDRQPSAMRERIVELEDALNALLSGETDDD